MHFPSRALTLCYLLSVGCSAGDDTAFGDAAALLDCCSAPERFPQQWCSEGVCLQRCANEADRTSCDPGQLCVARADAEGFICDGLCHDEACPARHECDAPDGRCFRPDACGQKVSCESASEICDPALDKCYPRNGTCSNDSGCPSFGEAVQAIATIRCEDDARVCRVKHRSLPNEWFSEDTTGSIAVNTPDPRKGSTFAFGSKLEFSWAKQPYPVLLRVLDRFPSDVVDYEAGLIWGASVASGNTLPFDAGTSRKDGVWKPGQPEPLGKGVYYFVVIGVEGGKKRRVSTFIPFGIDVQAFRAVGSSCTQVGTPGDCGNPNEPLTCHEGTCRRLCASHLDCGSGARCGDTVSGRRMCGVSVP